MFDFSDKSKKYQVLFISGVVNFRLTSAYQVLKVIFLTVENEFPSILSIHTFSVRVERFFYVQATTYATQRQCLPHPKEAADLGQD